MPVTHQEVMARLPAERRARIEENARKEIEKIRKKRERRRGLVRFFAVFARSSKKTDSKHA